METDTDIISIDQAKDLYGFSKSWLYKQTAARKLKHFKPGGKIYFDRKDLEQYIRDAEVKTISKLQSEATISLTKKL